MPTLLIRNADCVATFDHLDANQARELRQTDEVICWSLNIKLLTKPRSTLGSTAPLATWVSVWTL